MHAYLEADSILLDLLRALALLLVWRLNAQLQGQLGPRLELLGLELLDQLKQGKCAEALAPALWRSAECLAQGSRVGLEGHSGVAVEDEGGKGVLDRVGIRVPVRESPSWR